MNVFYNVCSVYVVVMSILFILWQIPFWYLYTGDENLREYCIAVPATQPHDIRVSEHNACLIDWGYFVREPVFISALVYVVLIGPVALVGYFIRRSLKKVEGHA